jgi:hypothetical protein
MKTLRVGDLKSLIKSMTETLEKLHVELDTMFYLVECLESHTRGKVKKAPKQEEVECSGCGKLISKEDLRCDPADGCCCHIDCNEDNFNYDNWIA